jgi:hypothetical protein
MRQRSEFAILLIGLIVAGILATPMAMAQNAAAPSLKAQLEAQYKLAKLAYASGQVTVTEPGTVLVIQRAGILGVPPGSLALAPAIYKDGSLNPPGKMATTMAGKGARLLPIGEKVYVTKMDISPKRDKITFRIMECDACKGTARPPSYKADIFFEFPKGSLAAASVSDVEDTIAKVFAIDTGGAEAPPAQPGAPAEQPAAAQPAQPEQPAAAQPAQPEQPAAAQPAQPEQPAAAEPAPAQAPTVQIHAGQTIDEVVAALGQPEKIVDLGSKKIYVYKDLKVTFIDGKVSDVQ